MFSRSPTLWVGKVFRYPGLATAMATLVGSFMAANDSLSLHGIAWVFLVAVLVYSCTQPKPIRHTYWLLLLLCLLVFIRWQSRERDYEGNCIQALYSSPEEPDPNPVRVTGHLVRFPRYFPDSIQVRLHGTKIEWRRRVLKCAANFQVNLPIPENIQDPYGTLWQDFTPGTTVEVLGRLTPQITYLNPGTDRGLLHLRVQDVHARIRVKNMMLFRVLRPAPLSVNGLVYRIRSLLRLKLLRAGRLPTGEIRPAASLMLGLWLGDRDLISSDWLAFMSRLGLLHILAISGLHLGLIAAALWVLLYFVFRLPRLLAYGLFIVLIGFYMLLVGAPPSVIRAGFVLVLYVIARVFFLPVDGVNLLGVIWTLMTLWQPEIVLDAGTQMTFGITFGLILGIKPFMTGVSRQRARWQGMLAMSFVAWVVSLPWSAGTFGKIPMLGPVWNLISWPVVTLVLLVGMVFPLLVLFPFGESILAGILGLMDIGLERLFMGGHDWTWTLLVKPGTPVFISLTIGVGTLLVIVHFGCKRTVSKAMIMILGGGVLVTGPAIVSRLHEIHEIMMMDIGQGDSIVLRVGHRAFVIDGGGLPESSWDLGYHVLVPALLHAGVTEVEGVVMTHPHIDHYSGLRAVIETFRPHRFYYPKGSWIPESLRSAPGFQKLRTQPVSAGDRWTWDSWSFRVLNPPASFQFPNGNLNEGSLVLLADWKGFRVLLTGDAERGAEAWMLQNAREFLCAEILKVGHHGSDSSTTQEFLSSVRPTIAIVSAGRRNRFGVPHSEVLLRLKSMHVFTLQTPKEGLIRIVPEHNPPGLSISTYRGIQPYHRLTERSCSSAL